jgi:hypothetical protein
MPGLPIELVNAVDDVIDAGPSSSPVDPQESVLDRHLTAPPGGESEGDRYIIASVATGVWTGKETEIAKWNGEAWIYTTPNEGMYLYVEDEDLMYSFNGTAWVATVTSPHVLASATHTASGLATGNVLRASGAATFAWAQLQHGDLGGVGAADHHTNANDPSANEKAALAGTSGSPSVTNKYATDADIRVCRTAAPELDELNIVGGAAVLSAGGDIKLVGRNLLQGQAFDAITLTEGGASLTLTALKPGDSGITVEIIAGVGALSATYNTGTGALAITLAAAGSTDDAIATLLNADISQCNGYIRANSAAGGNFTLAAVAAPMIGGTGTYAGNVVMVGGLEALPANETGTTSTAKWSNTGITCTSQAVAAGSDNVAIQVSSNSKWSLPLTALVNQNLLLPTADQKAALAGTSGAPSGANKYVTDVDPRINLVSAPVIDMLNVGGGAALNHVGADIILVGRNLLQGQTFDTLHLTPAGGADLTLAPLKPGVSGITVEIIAGAGVLSHTFNPGTGALVITLAAGGSSDDAIATAINANAAQTDGYVRAVSATGGNFTLASGPTPMTGGTGTYAQNVVMVGGLEALPSNEPGTNATAKWSNTQINCAMQAVGAATDIVTINGQSNAFWSNTLCGVMV